ncbi:MAG: GT4 family glycosyltransferase PelF, partial [Lachnospiraceae bacterium]|nr:GT4 family glycosyltransferase PelF [Lachnospiraceae bacterium]
PQNVTEVWEGYLRDDDYIGLRRRKKRLREKDRMALRSLVFGENVDWVGLFDFFENRQQSVNDLLMGMDFFDIVSEFYEKEYPQCVFTDMLWNLRSMYQPLFKILKEPVPRADCYHTVSTGYAGILACKGKSLYSRPLILSEHGIYTREREEELIRSTWTGGVYKDIWIRYFYTLSQCTYEMADRVISLFDSARMLQIDIGCPAEKTQVIPNGVEVAEYADLPGKDAQDTSICVGAFLRVVPIKDVKTLLYAFSAAKKKVPELKLYLMGPTDENPEYYQECQELIQTFDIRDVEFTGNIQVKEYMGKMDMSILTSISEGQPLTILEAMSAGCPCIATNVGGCRELLYGNGDGLGQAGLIVPVMNVEKIAAAIVHLAEDSSLREKMGSCGKARAERFYQKEMMIRRYQELYKAVMK